MSNKINPSQEEIPSREQIEAEEGYRAAYRKLTSEYNDHNFDCTCIYGPTDANPLCRWPNCRKEEVQASSVFNKQLIEARKIVEEVKATGRNDGSYKLYKEAIAFLEKYPAAEDKPDPFILYLDNEIVKIEDVLPVDIRNEFAIDLEGYLRCLKSVKEKYQSLHP